MIFKCVSLLYAFKNEKNPEIIAASENKTMAIKQTIPQTIKQTIPQTIKQTIPQTIKQTIPHERRDGFRNIDRSE
jgi:hypothetical protein